MTRPLMVAVSQGLDLLTFLMAVSMFGIQGEYGPARSVFHAGMGEIVILKMCGTIALMWMVQSSRWPRIRSWSFVPAVASGLIYASVNLIVIQM